MLIKALVSKLCSQGVSRSLAVFRNDTCLMYMSSRSRLFASPPSPTVVDKGDFGKFTIRLMEQTDYPDAIELVKSRQFIGFGESDLSFLLNKEYKSAVGIVVENDQKEILGFTACVGYDMPVLCGGYHVVKECYRGAYLGVDILNYMYKFLGSQEMHQCAVSYGKTPLQNYYDKVDLHFDFGMGTFYWWEGKFDKHSKFTLPHVRPEIKCLDDSYMDALIEYDAMIHLCPRPEILRAMCQHDSTICLVALGDDNTVCGYVLLRHCFMPGGYKIAPLFADSRDIALQLLHKSADSLPDGTKITIVTGSNNTVIEQNIVNNGFKKKTTWYRQKSGLSMPIPLDIDFSKVYCLSNLTYSIC